MNKRTFKSVDGLELLVKSRKSAVIFEIVEVPAAKHYNFIFCFEPEVFKELQEYIELVANQSWDNLNPKEANSFGADYWEYYDKELDNNGMLSIGDSRLNISRPSAESNRLYKFNKRKMESFIYDFRKLMEG
ncbi:hypothetical protein C2I06_09570 [Niallia circulans]|uniref:hypothetical protein n=1 Tax=Niallia circulans TaxID=1397 RepID=UPI000F45CF5D|nr:hypothetical protein [Niallia circulans]AYV67102.1 hypothetical protein C2I06_09570 [Niallia circulans]